MHSTIKVVVNERGKRKTAIARATVKIGSKSERINNTCVDIPTPEISRKKVIVLLSLSKEIWGGYGIGITVKGRDYMSEAETSKMATARVLFGWKDESSLRALFVDYEKIMHTGDLRERVQGIRRGSDFDEGAKIQQIRGMTIQ